MVPQPVMCAHVIRVQLDRALELGDRTGRIEIEHLLYPPECGVRVR